MTSLIEFALKSQYPQTNIDGLMQVINSTKNPIISTEIILGIYEMPNLYTTLEDTDQKANIKLVSFDAVNQTVTFSYNRKKTEYVVTKIATDEIIKKTDNSYYVKEYRDNPEMLISEIKSVDDEVLTNTSDIDERHSSLKWRKVAEKTVYAMGA